jgi:zinc protease
MGKTLEQFLALAWTKHPYAWTPAGTLADLDSITLAEAQAFYDRWYQPNNAVLVISGDVETERAMALVRKHFARVKAGVKPVATIEPEPPQTALRETTVRFDTELPVIIGGYKIPEQAHADTAALEVLGQILSAGQTSRLYRTLVRDAKIAVFAGGGTEGNEDPGLFLIYAGFLPTGPADDGAIVRKALLDEVEKVAAAGVDARELAKAKSQLTAGHVFGLDTAEGKAFGLGNAELLEGGWQKFVDGATKYDRVTAADIQRVAKTYLTRERLTLVTMLPSAASEDGGKE